MKSDLEKLIIVGLASITLMGLAGCNQDRDSNAYGAPKTSTVSSTESLTETVTEQMTEEKSDITTEARYADVEEFMEYYNISEDEIPKDYIQDLIWIYSIGPDFKENQTDAGDTVKRFYQNNRDLYLSLNDHFNGAYTNLPLEEYMQNVTMIKFRFSFEDGEFGVFNEGAIDLKEGKIYYDHGVLAKLDSAEYTADLSDEEIESIRRELPKHIVEDVASGELQGLNDYGIEIRMRDDKYETKYIIVTGSNEAGAPGFDEYWKTLFKNSFGEEWKLW